MPKDLPDFGSMYGKSGRGDVVPIPDSSATEIDVEAFKASVLAKLALAVGKDGDSATARDWFVATALALRDRVIHRWLAVNRASRRRGQEKCLLPLPGISDRPAVRRCRREFAADRNRRRRARRSRGRSRPDAPRRARCGARQWRSRPARRLSDGEHGEPRHPAFGYGIRYDHGLFRQVIRDGWQQEFAEEWLSFGNPWEFARPEVRLRYPVRRPGRDETVGARRVRPVWRPDETIEAVAYDTPIVGWRGRHVNPLRLWSARAVDPLRLEMFNEGDHVGALWSRPAPRRSRKSSIRATTLRPAANCGCGRSISSSRPRCRTSSPAPANLQRSALAAGAAAIQLNDTHPSIAIAEMMRLLVDVYTLPWERRGRRPSARSPIPTTRCCPRRWSAGRCELFARVLPRHLEIIYRINATHLEAARGQIENGADGAALSIIDESNGRHVRMGHLAFIGSHRVNGVSALHTELMRETVFADLHVSIPSASSTRPTASPSGAGCTKPIRG